jgi:hypothetical protein
MAVEIWLRQLVSQNPRSLVLSKSPALNTQAYELELALNNTLRTMDFSETLSECVRSAIFMIGAMKVGVAPKQTYRTSDYQPVGDEVYADTVLMEDLAFDMNARRIGEWDWCANRYRLPYYEVMNNPNYDPAVRDKIRPHQKSNANMAPSDVPGETSNLTVETSITDTEFVDHVELWDVWLPGDGLLVTIPAQQGLQALETREWDGPEHGPFHILAMNQIPGNVMPSAPIQHLYEMQSLLTKLFNQLARQALRQKTVTLATSQAVQDGTARKVREASDGDIVPVTHVDQIREMRYGGADPGNMRMAMWCKDLFGYEAGNMDQMGGLAQQGDTLGQEQMLAATSSEMLKDMQAKVVTFTSNVMKDVAWYVYNDPIKEYSLSKEVENYGQIAFTYGPERRDADFVEFNFELAPYTLVQKGPQERLGMIMTLMQQNLLPMAPQLAAFGRQINIDVYLDLISKYADLPELKQLVAGGPSQMDGGIQGGGGGRPQSAPVTSRNYTRQSKPTPETAQGREAQMMKELSNETSQ